MKKKIVVVILSSELVSNNIPICPNPNFPDFLFCPVIPYIYIYQRIYL